MVGERGHMNIPIVVERMGSKGRKCFAVFGEIVALAFALVILVYGGIQITGLAMGQMTSALTMFFGVTKATLSMAETGMRNMLSRA